MHELSIAMSILDIAKAEAVKAKALVIKEIEIDVGTLAGIEFESLEFAFPALCSGTMFEQTNVIVNQIQAQSECLECGGTFQVSRVFNQCPSCSGSKTKLICGKELKVKSLLIE